MPPTRDLQRRSLFPIVAAATVVGLILRIWPIGRLGLNQFDEGIYAMAAGWAFAPGGLKAIDPSLIPYAPPGYPILVGVLTWLSGWAEQAGFLCSAFLGSLTIPVVALIAHQVFGPRAAGVSAWCVCLSGPHIAFSRMALTDASFLFVWSLGFAVGIRFLNQPQFWTGLLMGSLVGLAQQFKYNGWLLGGFIIANALLNLLIDPAARHRSYWTQLASWGGLAILIAGCVVFPWFRFVENHGGYAALLAHQRSYLGGTAGWWPHLMVQAREAVMLSGSVGQGAITAALIGFTVRWVGPTASASPWRCLVAAGLAWPLLASPVTVGLLAVPKRLFSSCLAERFVAISWIILFLLSPFYHPYARLWLPFEMLQWVLIGGMVVELLADPGERILGRLAPIGRRGFLWAWGSLAALTLVAGPGFPLLIGERFDHDGLFLPSDSLRVAADEICREVPREVIALRTLVRPALSYYLVGRLAVFAQSDPHQLERGTNGRQWGLVDSTVLASTVSLVPGADPGDPLALFRRRWEVVAEIKATTTLPTRLDLDPGSSGRAADQVPASLWLIRLRTTDTSP